MDGPGGEYRMARTKRNHIRLIPQQEKLTIENERKGVLEMVEHFDRKGIKDTYWHKTLVRLDAALKQYEGVKDG